jgi:hypothetical protein
MQIFPLQNLKNLYKRGAPLFFFGIDGSAIRKNLFNSIMCVLIRETFLIVILVLFGVCPQKP